LNIRKRISKIYREGDFLLASILSGMKKVEISSGTAAVGLDHLKKSLCLYYNPEFFDTLTSEEELDVLRHEAMHIAQCHITRSSDRNHKQWNVATDMNINQYLPNIPNNCIVPKPDYPLRAASDIYYDLVDGDPDFEDVEGSDHSMWGEVQDDSSICNKIESETGEKVREAAEAGDRSARALLKLYVKPSKRKWIAEIRRMFTPTRPSLKYKSNSFDKRRTYHNGDEMIPARCMKPDSHRVFVALDTSASITEDQIQKFLSEVRSIAGSSEVTLLTFDTEVNQELDISSKMSQFEVIGRGGTDFQPVFDRVAEEGTDRNLIILTDGFAGEPEIKKKTRVLWAIIEGGNMKPSPIGRVTSLDF
jgi:predicted metal-dependent peptidase